MYTGNWMSSGRTLRSEGDVTAWIDRYDTGIERLIEEFGSSLRERKVLGIVPFIPILRTLVKKESRHIWCGSGVDSFSIMTSGSIEACPIAPELVYSNIGDIRETTPGDIENSRTVGEPCTDCDILWVCGGRCLFANQTMSWGREWFDRVCLSSRRMIEGLDALVPEVESLIEERILSPEALDYPEINNGCEIIP